jgi:hypothetical protein
MTKTKPRIVTDLTTKEKVDTIMYQTLKLETHIEDLTTLVDLVMTHVVHWTESGGIVGKDKETQKIWEESVKEWLSTYKELRK